MAISLGDALGISKVRLPRQSVMAFDFSESGDCAKTCPCIGWAACFKH